MDVLKMITELRAERSAIEEAIIVLERMARSHGKRRGRPPAWLKAATAGSGSDAGDLGDAPKRVVSEATRRKMAIAQRKRRAAMKKAEKSAAQG
jgi:hypothetical protein